MILSQQQRIAGLAPDVARRVIEITTALKQRRLDDAERGVIGAFAMAPTHPEVLQLLGRVQCLRGRFHEGLDTLIQACAARPNDASIHADLGSAHAALKDFARALDELRLACELGPEDPSHWFAYGRRLLMDGHAEAALAPLRRAVTLSPNYAPARALLANMLRSDGKFAEAADEYRRIIADGGSGVGAAWWGLAMLKPVPFTDAEIDTMKHCLHSGSVGEIDRIFTGSALAIALENRGDYRGAYAEMQKAHGLAKRTEPFDSAAFHRHIEGILETFTGSGARAPNDQGDEVIFIVSLPRSGSTLTEQILASHSQVEGATELADLTQIIMDESDRQRRSFLHWSRDHTPEQWQTLGEEYLRRTARWRTRRPKFTDKAPGNWQYVGLILAMLPKAKIVVARRDPLETCFGCYRYIITQQPYVHDIDSLAAYWHEFDRTIAHWQRAYPGRVREQIYENVVADPETQIRELLEFCELPFEEACLNFHATERRVSTPSASQVREPIRKDTARTGKYGALLDPLRRALGLPLFTD